MSEYILMNGGAIKYSCLETTVVMNESGRIYFAQLIKLLINKAAPLSLQVIWYFNNMNLAFL